MTVVAASNAEVGAAAVPTVRPFLKWAGGKTRLLPRLLPYVPDRFNDYHEPFLGGGAMFFSVRGRALGRSHLHDLNQELTNVWRCVQEQPDLLLEALKYYLKHDSKDFYYVQRTTQPTPPVEQAARFVYLNQTSWNGLWRVNRWGGFNVPWGDRPFRGLDATAIRHTSLALNNAAITSEDFRETLRNPQRGDFVYLDPPYLPISDTSKFYLYTERRFRYPDLEELAGICRELDTRGVHWMMSNRDTEQVRRLFPKNRIVRFTARRSVAAQNQRDVEHPHSPEALILGNGLA